MSDFVLIPIDKEDDIIDDELQAKYGSTLSLDLPEDQSISDLSMPTSHCHARSSLMYMTN